MSEMYVQEQNHCNYNLKLFPLKAAGWMVRKKEGEMKKAKAACDWTVDLQSAGILIEIKFPSLCSSLVGRNKNTGCLERRGSSSFSTVNKTLWSQPFKIGFTWINKSLTGVSRNTVNEIAQEGRRLWVIDCDSNTHDTANNIDRL